jgi:NAD+ synthase
MDRIDGKVYACVLPGSNTSDSRSDDRDAQALCNKFDIVWIISPIDDLIENTAETIYCLASTLTKVSRGNMASRIRSNVLHTIAECENCLVCGTGNWDEDFGVGYYTLFGDGAVHMSPIGNLSKRLVYQMAEHLGVPESIIKKSPSARLEEGQTDFGDLGYGYGAVEIFSESLAQKLDVYETLKDYPYNKNMFSNYGDFIDDLTRRRRVAASKARLVSPDIAQVTLIYDED